MGSGDGVCSLGVLAVSHFSEVLPKLVSGGSKSLTTISYTQGLSTSLRKLPSDALSIHHFTPDLVFVGLRSSSILLEDLRVNPTPRNVVASMRRGKAVVGVRRLRDSASPWGLVASAMGDEVSRTGSIGHALTTNSYCCSTFDSASRHCGISRGTSITFNPPSSVLQPIIISLTDMFRALPPVRMTRFSSLQVRIAGYERGQPGQRSGWYQTKLLKFGRRLDVKRKTRCASCSSVVSNPSK